MWKSEDKVSCTSMLSVATQVQFTFEHLVHVYSMITTVTVSIAHTHAI